MARRHEAARQHVEHVEHGSTSSTAARRARQLRPSTAARRARQRRAQSGLPAGRREGRRTSGVGCRRSPWWLIMAGDRGDRLAGRRAGAVAPARWRRAGRSGHRSRPPPEAAPPAQARISVSSPRRNRWHRTPPVPPRPLAGILGVGRDLQVSPARCRAARPRSPRRSRRHCRAPGRPRRRRPPAAGRQPDAGHAARGAPLWPDAFGGEAQQLRVRRDQDEVVPGSGELDGSDDLVARPQPTASQLPCSAGSRG